MTPGHKTVDCRAQNKHSRERTTQRQSTQHVTNPSHGLPRRATPPPRPQQKATRPPVTPWRAGKNPPPCGCCCGCCCCCTCCCPCSTGVPGIESRPPPITPPPGICANPCGGPPLGDGAGDAPVVSATPAAAPAGDTAPGIAPPGIVPPGIVWPAKAGDCCIRCCCCCCWFCSCCCCWLCSWP